MRSGQRHFFKYLSLAILVSLLFISCKPKIPVITSIDPKIGRMGEVVTLTGSNFGEARDDSYITIAGIAPTSSSYFLWQDDIIMVKVPELGDSGLVFAHVKGKKSNGVLFSNSASVPRPIEGEGLGSEPAIISVNPQYGPPGTLVTINGINFGTGREPADGAGVFFSWDFTSSSNNPFAVREQEYVQVSDNELGYISWTPRQIVVRVPDGAVSGNMEVRTPDGRSRPIYYNVTGKPGAKVFSNKRSYTVSYSVDIRVLEATHPNNLNLWMPIPATTPAQRNIRLVSRSMEPYIENYHGTNVFVLNNLSTGANRSVNVSYQVDVHEIGTEIRAVSLGKIDSTLSQEYTASTNLIPAENSLVLSTAENIIGREQNQYLKARLIYDWLIANINILETNQPAGGNVINAINQKRADSYTAALLYSALMRAAGVPCVPVAGVLIDSGGQTARHYWTEFWIDAFGWVPVDPVLGAGVVPAFAGTTSQSAGAIPPAFNVKEDYVNYYFGNMDNQRIAFSWNQPVISRFNRNSRIVTRTQSYSLQNIWEEAVGGLESYTSLWGDITISGVYAQ